MAKELFLVSTKRMLQKKTNSPDFALPHYKLKAIRAIIRRQGSVCSSFVVSPDRAKKKLNIYQKLSKSHHGDIHTNTDGKQS